MSLSIESSTALLSFRYAMNTVYKVRPSFKIFDNKDYFFQLIENTISLIVVHVYLGPCIFKFVKQTCAMQCSPLILKESSIPCLFIFILRYSEIDAKRPHPTFNTAAVVTVKPLSAPMTY